MSDHVVAIVQARLGSSRLPRKVLEPIAGDPMILHVMRRAARISGVHTVIAAIPCGDYELEYCLKRAGFIAYMGSPGDVLERYAAAARATAADVVVRVTGDCPLFDPDIAADLLIPTLNDPRAFYTAYTVSDGGMDGFDVEVCRRWILETAHREATEPADREHVTPWIRRNCINRMAGRNPFSADWKCSVDTRDELEMVRRVHKHIAPGKTSMLATLTAAAQSGEVRVF